VNSKRARLILEDGNRFEGFGFGYPCAAAGEVVFNTGMVGYPESLTDPSYFGQILVLTYPLIGNYGVPASDLPLQKSAFESERIQVQGLIIAENSVEYSHPQADQSLSDWLSANRIPGICGIDTRRLTQILRNQGSMLGKIVFDEDVPFYDPNNHNIVQKVTSRAVAVIGGGTKRVALLDCGCKLNIIRKLLAHNLQILRLPYDADLSRFNFNGLLVSNGPGNPKECLQPVRSVRYALEQNIPILGICLGHQILALAIGADTYKLKYGHHSQNQPVQEENSQHCLITSQNHGFAVDVQNLPDGWTPWFRNLNDGTNEGLLHQSGRFMSVQFHPEAAPGPEDTEFIFKRFINEL
jgi:carbamoyl-phosphate synthase small subunit